MLLLVADSLSSTSCYVSESGRAMNSGVIVLGGITCDVVIPISAVGARAQSGDMQMPCEFVLERPEWTFLHFVEEKNW